MIFSQVLSRVSRTICRSSLLLSAAQKPQQLPIFANEFHSLIHSSSNKFQLVPSQMMMFQRSFFNIPFYPRVGFSSNSSPEISEEALTEDATSGEAQTKDTGTITESGSESAKRNRASKRTAFFEPDSDSDNESTEDLSRDDLIKLVTEKDELLKLKQKEMEQMQDKVLRTYAEMENVMDRTRREAENSKKFAIQNFAKSLLDVADNLGRGSMVVNNSFSKIDTSKDSAGVEPLLKTLLEGVEMTEKQLAEVFRKFGVEKFDPMNEPFDPNRHNALFQVPADNSKPPGTVAAVLKAGYMLHDRVIRPAEVGVVQESDKTEASQE